MHIILANPRGFCAGVNMAIESLEKALDLFGTPLYVFHEIVHNRPVVERFRKRGVIFVDSIDEIPSGCTVLYSAHGVAPQIRQASAEQQPSSHRRNLPVGHEGSHRGDCALRKRATPSFSSAMRDTMKFWGPWVKRRITSYSCRMSAMSPS